MAFVLTLNCAENTTVHGLSSGFGGEDLRNSLLAITFGEGVFWAEAGERIGEGAEYAAFGNGMQAAELYGGYFIRFSKRQKPSPPGTSSG